MKEYDVRIFSMDDVMRQLHANTSDVLRPEDHEALRAIEAACGVETGELAELVMAYYRDADRAARTPHAILQLHIGMLAGRLLRLSSKRRRR
jgi:hypothetical protein